MGLFGFALEMAADEDCSYDPCGVNSETKEEYSQGSIVYGAGSVFGDRNTVYVSVEYKFASDTVEE